jgi:hypothetical protein
MVIKFIASLFLIGAAWFMYQLANIESVPLMERFGAFVYMALFIILALFTWTRK